MALKDIQHVQDRGSKKIGKQQLIDHLSGKDITPGDMIKAKCYDCMGFYVDGAADCEMPDCSLYPKMPYNPNMKKRPISDELRKSMSERMKRLREKQLAT